MARLTSQPIVGFAGPTGAGKTTGAGHFVATRKFGYVRYSQVLADWKLQEAADHSLQAIGWEVMLSGLQPELNRLVIQKVEDFKNVGVAVDGLRSPIDLNLLSSHFGQRFRLLYVTAPTEVRWTRKRAQRRFASLSEFTEADRHPVEQPLWSLSIGAYRVIENAGSLQAYYLVLDEVASDLTGEHL